MTLADLANTHATWENATSAPTTTAMTSTKMPPSTAWICGSRDDEHPGGLRATARRETSRPLGPARPAYWHLLVEAKKLAYSDPITRFNADPCFSSVPVSRLISKSYARRTLRPPLIRKKASTPEAKGDPVGGTGVSGGRRSLGKYGVVHLQHLRQLWFRHYSAGLWFRVEWTAVRYSRSRPNSPKPDRPGQAALPHIAAGIPHEGRTGR